MAPVGKVSRVLWALGGAVQPHPHLNAELPAQGVGHKGRVRVLWHHRHHGGPVFRPGQTHQPQIGDGRRPPEEPARQGLLMGPDGVDACFLQPGQGRVKAHDPRQVQSPGLEPVRQEGRHLLGVAGAAGAAGQQRLQLRGQLRPQQEAPGALGTHQPLVAGEGQGVRPHGLHVDGEGPGGLGGVQQEQQAVFPAEGPPPPPPEAGCRRRCWRGASPPPGCSPAAGREGAPSSACRPGGRGSGRR